VPSVFTLKRHVEQCQETGCATATMSARTQICEAARARNEVRLKEDEVAVYDLFDDGTLEAREHDMRATFEQSLHLESAKDPFMEALRALVMGVPMKGDTPLEIQRQARKEFSKVNERGDHFQLIGSRNRPNLIVQKEGSYNPPPLWVPEKMAPMYFAMFHLSILGVDPDLQQTQHAIKAAVIWSGNL
jgi:hypothetical protein